MIDFNLNSKYFENMQFYKKKKNIPNRHRHLSIQVLYGMFFCKIEYFQNIYLLRLKMNTGKYTPGICYTC